MPETLAQKVRAKYPGAYNDLSDAQLESAVLAKHPEYGDLPRTAAGPKPVDANEPDTFAGGFARSLGKTAYDTGRGIVSGAASLLDPRTYGSLITAKDAADRGLGTQRATVPLSGQLQQIGNQISDPYEGGKLIGQLAGGELLPRAAAAVAPKVGPGISAVGRGAEQAGDFLKHKADWAAAAEVVHGGPAALPAAVVTAGAPRVVSAAGRGAQRLGALLTKAPVSDIDHSFSVKNASAGPPTTLPERPAAFPPIDPRNMGPSAESTAAHQLAEQENIDNGSHFGMGHILPDPPAARPSELRDDFVEGNSAPSPKDTPTGLSAMTRKAMQDSIQREIEERAAVRGTPADVPDNPAAQALEAARQAAGSPQARPAKVSLADAQIASRSKRGGASGTPGLTVNDMQELGVDPSVRITAIAPDAVELLKRKRAERASMYKYLAELDKKASQ